MRKINNIWYVIWFFIGISLLVPGCKNGIEGKKWFEYASKFDKARSIMWANEMAKKETALQDMARMDKLRQKYLQSKQPTETEMISVLRSPDRRIQKVGLAAMFLKPIETNQLIDILFEFLQDQDREFKGYAVIALDKFTKFPEFKKDNLGRKLLEIIKKEKDKEVLRQEFYLLAKFPSEEAARFLAEQFMREGQKGKEQLHFRIVIFNALKEMEDKYYNQAAEYINKYGTSEIKKELLDRENSWKLINDPTAK